MKENERKLLIGLHELEGVGWVTIQQLLTNLDSLTDVLGMDADQLRALGIGRKQAQAIFECSMERIEARLRIYEQASVEITTILDEEYPEWLSKIPRPPMVLYTIGDRSLWHLPLIGIVGTRNPTVYGKKVGEELAYELAAFGFGVVSGLARGIDTIAHRGALRADNGVTIAVLGSAVNEVYPPENLSYYREIAKRGLIVSEFPLGTKISPGLFPLRNRIIAGLSYGVIVVEAAKPSGALITAELAFETNRDVFAVPGPITSPKSEGCAYLMKSNMAMVITSPDDIVEKYKYLPAVAKLILKNKQGQNTAETSQSLSEDERKILRILTGEAKTFDALMDLSHYNFGHLHSVLLSLLMKKKIAALPGSSYIAL